MDNVTHWIVDTTKKVNFTSNNDDSKPEESNDGLIDIANNFNAVKKIGPPIGKNLVSIPK